MSRIIGIDLGTTFSAVSIVRDGHPEILPKGSERIIPSIVGLAPDGERLVGTPARNQALLHPENTIRSIKRKMGTDETVLLGGRPCSPTEISALILKEMKHIAEADLGEPVDRAVITVPAFFTDAARQATQEAGELAGFTVERIINEPTAAALAYGLDRVEDNQLVAVYDLGGGTFDVSIIELNQGVIEVRASHGDTRLGGDDFDALLTGWLVERFVQTHGAQADPTGDPRAMARLARTAEAAKIALSVQPFVRAREEYLLERAGKPLHLDQEVSRPEFEALILPLLERSLACFDQALADAQLQASDLDRILLVGGSTRIPLVWELLAQHTGLEPMTELNPDEAVALGAGVQAAIIDGEPIEAVLVDLTPHSVGIEVAEWRYGSMVPDCYERLIHRNTALPTTRAKTFSALHPDQTEIQVVIYQGEDPVASENTLLGEFSFKGLKPEQPGIPPVVMVEFDMDLNGILHVSATDRGSRKVAQTTVHAAHVRLSPCDKALAARFLDGGWDAAEDDRTDLTQPQEGDDPILAKARSFLAAHPEASGQLTPLLGELDRALARGADERAQELLDEILDALYELEGPGMDDGLAPEAAQTGSD
jgi:molecular chaperone DnaK